MRLVLFSITVSILFVLPISGQGLIDFNNLVPPLVDARGLGDEGPLGKGWAAQLLVGTDMNSLAPAFPTTTFKSGSIVELGYFDPVTVVVPGIAPGEPAWAVVRVYPMSESFQGFSNPFRITLGGGGTPPAELIGLRPFYVLPEPGSLPLLVLGGAALCVMLLLRPSIRNSTQHFKSSKARVAFDFEAG